MPPDWLRFSQHPHQQRPGTCSELPPQAPVHWANHHRRPNQDHWLQLATSATERSQRNAASGKVLLGAKERLDGCAGTAGLESLLRLESLNHKQERG